MNKNTNSRHWFLTWETNKLQKKLPSHLTLIEFFNYNCDEAIFQLERGEKAQKNHWQGCFILTGVRKSKRAVLDLFKERFKNVSGLTIQRTHSQDSVELYVTKEETRLKGPFYAGNKVKFDLELANSMELKAWQQDLFDFMKNHEEFLRDRKVIYVEDEKGGSGKSTFIKWLRTAQRFFKFRALPQASVDRVASAVNIICKDTKLDVLAFDITREQGMDQHDQDLFAIIESIKNGYVIDVMYGRMNEAIFKPPIVVIFSNKPFLKVRKYLSHDRWIVCQPTSEGLIVSEKDAIHPGAITPINFKLFKNSSYETTK